jgi:hypothetical protein
MYRPTGKLRRPGRKSASRASHMWMLCEQKEALRDGIDQPISDLDTVAFLGSVEPYRLQVALGLRCQPMGH